MGPDLQIDWTTVCKNPADFEKQVKLLLQRLNPRGQVLDGTGCDGGREFQVSTADRLELYEAKSFTGRVSKRNPKRQVARHLDSQTDLSKSSLRRNVAEHLLHLPTTLTQARPTQVT